MLYIGGGKDINTLKNKVHQLGLDDNIIIAGRLEDRNDLVHAYTRADLFLFPSLYDANSLVQIEAASQKTPTLFIREAITSTTVEEDVSGFMAEGTTDAYANKIIEIITNEDYLQKVSEGAYTHLYKSWSDVVAIAKEEYIRLINQNKK